MSLVFPDSGYGGSDDEDEHDHDYDDEAGITRVQGDQACREKTVADLPTGSYYPHEECTRSAGFGRRQELVRHYTMPITPSGIY